MNVIGVATEFNACVANWTTSIVKNHGKPILLGLGNTWEGWPWRTSLYLSALRELPQNDVVLVTDVYDVLVLRDLRDLKADFKRTGKRVLLNTEDSHSRIPESPEKWADLFYAKYPDQPQRHFNTLNAGQVIGYVSDLIQFYEEVLEVMKKTGNDDDQDACIHMFHEWLVDERKIEPFALDFHLLGCTVKHDAMRTRFKYGEGDLIVLRENESPVYTVHTAAIRFSGYAYNEIGLFTLGHLFQVSTDLMRNLADGRDWYRRLSKH